MRGEIELFFHFRVSSFKVEGGKKGTETKDSEEKAGKKEHRER